MSRRGADWVTVALLLIGTALFAWRFVNFSVPGCVEDAAPLLRYAANLAAGHGIVWNIGEAPVDGATDFLCMVLVALIHKLGPSLELSIRILTVGSHLIGVPLIYLFMRIVEKTPLLPAALSAIYFAVGPGLFLAAAGWGTPLFALAVIVAWMLALRMILAGASSPAAAFTFGIAGLIMGLIRPEGVLIALFMLAAVGMMIPFRQSAFLIGSFAGIFLVFGGTYFLWRWHYFGHPLPNPFYRKGAGIVHPESLRHSIGGVAKVCYPFFLAFILALRSRSTSRLAFCFAIPIAGFTVMWVLVSNDMNFGARFQYPILGVVILCWYPLVKDLPRDLHWPDFRSLPPRARLAVLAAAWSIIIGLIGLRITASQQLRYFRRGTYDVAMILRPYADRGYTVATTENGLIPFYSRWRAIDTWGLNDAWIAHNGRITDEYLRRQHPDVIMFHVGFSPIWPRAREPDNPWMEMVLTLQRYAIENHFKLVAAFGAVANDAHYYYVRDNWPDGDQIAGKIRSVTYWYDGQKCVNFALLTPLQQSSQP
jgi:hypothetical protein